MLSLMILSVVHRSILVISTLGEFDIIFMSCDVVPCSPAELCTDSDLVYCCAAAVSEVKLGIDEEPSSSMKHDLLQCEH